MTSIRENEYRHRKINSRDHSLSIEKKKSIIPIHQLELRTTILKKKTNCNSVSSSPKHKIFPQPKNIRIVSKDKDQNYTCNETKTIKLLKTDNNNLRLSQFNHLPLEKNHSSRINKQTTRNEEDKEEIASFKKRSSSNNYNTNLRSIKVHSSARETLLKYETMQTNNIMPFHKSLSKTSSVDYLTSSSSEKYLKLTGSNKQFHFRGTLKSSLSTTAGSFQTERGMKSTINQTSLTPTKSVALLSPQKQLFDSSNVISSQRSLEKSESNLTKLNIFLLTNWGNKEFIGLKEIQLNDMKNNKIQIIKCNVKNGRAGNIMNVFKVIISLYTGVKKRTLWLSPFTPQNSQYQGNSNKDSRNKKNTTLLLEVFFPSNIQLKSITFYNYSGKDKTIGAKDVEVYDESHKLLCKGLLPLLKDNDYQSTVFNISRDEDKENFYPIKKILVNRKRFERTGFQTNKNSQTMIKSSSSGFKLFNVQSLEDFDTTPSNNDNDNTLSKAKTLSKIIPLETNDIIYNTNDHSNDKSIECIRIKLILLSNYGHRKHVGLTNLMFINNYNEIIDIQSQAKIIKAHPRDIATYLNMKTDKRKFDNIFNNTIQTIEERNMWLTKLNHVSIENDNTEDNCTYINIIFTQSIKLSKVIFNNFNSPKSLDKGLKTGILQCYDETNSLLVDYPFYLHKGIGNDYVDYSQEISFPFSTPVFSNAELQPFLNPNIGHLKTDQQYKTPYLPTGFILTIQLINNYKHESLIGIKSIELYDQLGRNILETHPYSVYCYPSREIPSDCFLMKYINLKVTDNDHDQCNKIYYVFHSPVSLSYMRFISLNTNDYDDSIRAKDIKVFIDDYIIFEGSLFHKEKHIDNDLLHYQPNEPSFKKETSVLFTGDEEIISNVNMNNLSKST